jgi:hypothetical protein
MVEEVVETISPGGIWLAAGVALGTAFGRQLRPVAKSAVKAGMAATERLRELGAEAVEQTQDLVAEARHEREQERSRPAEIAEAPPRRQRAAPEAKPG